MNYNEKTQFIDSLISSMDIINRQNNIESNGYVTYFTAGLIVKGIPFEFEPFQSEDPEALQEEMVEKSSSINAFNVAHALYTFMKKQRIDEEDAQYYDENKILILKDAKIKDLNTNSNYNLSHFVLFVDQVIGVFPGEITWD